MATAIDVTPAFNVVLYAIFFESLLFFIVIMQTKSIEPGAHTGIARYFGWMFLFQSFAALTTALSEQFYQGTLSYVFAILSIGTTILAIGVTIPASVSVAVPEANRTKYQVPLYIIWLLTIVFTAVLLGPSLKPRPDLPYIDPTLQREVLAAILASLGVLYISTIIRMIRPIKGRNGAFILLAGIALVFVFGFIWSLLEPSCRTSSPLQKWPEECPLPKSFDHNFVLGIVVMIANVLAAEGVLRLMAAGSGVEGYAEIVPVIPT